MCSAASRPTPRRRSSNSGIAQLFDGHRARPGAAASILLLFQESRSSGVAGLASMLRCTSASSRSACRCCSASMQLMASSQVVRWPPRTKSRRATAGRGSSSAASHFGGLQRLAGQAGNHQRRKNLLRLQAVIQAGILQLLGKAPAGSLAPREHANQPPLDGLGSAPDQLATGLDFAAPLLRCFAQRRTEQRLINPKLLRDPRAHSDAKCRSGFSEYTARGN